jgi:adenylate cyclase
MAAAARRALGMDPRLIEARLHLALVSLHRKDYAAAKSGLEDVLRDRPDYYEACRWLGILSDMTGQYDDAVAYYQKAAEIKPCSVEPWLLVNMTHRRRGDLSAAMEAAKRFLEVGLRVLHVSPDDPVTLSRFCPIYTLFGDTERARSTLDRILRTGTEDGLVLYNCAATYALLGDPDNSLSCLRKALSGGYQNVRVWIEGDPDFAGIRETAAFRALLSEFDLHHRDDRDYR